jgi:hypothetical protein
MYFMATESLLTREDISFIIHELTTSYERNDKEQSLQRKGVAVCHYKE